jgi:Predicted nucleoside-diphosphate-sugar epimerases
VKLLPIVPLFSNNKFQCVYVKDIADGLIRILEDRETVGKIYEFGGPEVMTLKEIYQLILKTLKIKRIILHLPLTFANVIALLMKLSPSPMITFDQVKMLKKDNVVSDTSYNLSSLGIIAKSSKDIIGNYIS